MYRLAAASQTDKRRDRRMTVRCQQPIV